MTEQIPIYWGDVPLFNKLGLPLLYVPEDHKLHRVGLADLADLGDGASVELWVEAWPALFWTATIRTENGDVYHVKTGSGIFRDFWPSFELMARGMLEVTPVASVASLSEVLLATNL